MLRFGAQALVFVFVLLSAAAAPGAGRSDRPTASLDVMIGQMIVVGFLGAEPGDPEIRRIRRRLANGRIGGVILLQRNAESAEQVRRLTRSLHRAGAPYPPLISVDQEGGAVQRLDERRGFREIPSAREIAADRTPEQAESLFNIMAKELAASGVNVNYGPVVDLDLNRRNPIIGRYGRSFGARPERVVRYARQFIAAHHAHGVLTAIKHFPGHGSSTADTHKQFVDISSSWREVELDPFRRLIKRREMVDMVMVGHLTHPRFTRDGAPASLSSRAIRRELREKLGYRGVVVTDDLDMGAITRFYSRTDATIRAVKAGNDILLFSNYPDYDPALADKIHQIIKRAVASGRIPRRRIVEAFNRIRAMKRRLTP